MINASAAFVAWNPLDEDDHNGALLGYKVSQGQLYQEGKIMKYVGTLLDFSD